MFYIILIFMTELTMQSNISAQNGRLNEQEMGEMLKAGVHLGHSKSKNHPSMKPYIFGIRNTVSIIDLAKTEEMFNTALNFIRNTVTRGGGIILVGTRPTAKLVLTEIASAVKMPYLVDRWIGGTLTNFKVIVKRVEYMENLEKEKAANGFEKYTKKERLKKGEEIEKLNRMFNGLRNMKKMPEAVFVVDITQDQIAVDEAIKMHIPVIALVDTNANSDLVDYPIPSNDDAMPAVKYMMGKVGRAIEEGLSQRGAASAESVSK